MRPQRCMENGETCQQAQRKELGHIPLAYRSLVITSAIFDETRGKIFCGRFCSINAHAEQGRFDFAELETLRASRNPTTVITANGEVQTNEEATVHVYDLHSFVTVRILEDTPAVPSLGKLCEEYRYSCEWASGQEPHQTQNGRKSNATRKTMYRSLFQDYQPVLPVRQQVLLVHR